MDSIEEYSILYPTIPIELVLFFSNLDKEDSRNQFKNVMQFCSYYSKKHKTAKILQPRIIAAICDLLVSYGHLSLINKSGPDNVSSTYFSVVKDDNLRSYPVLQELTNQFLSFNIYGFPFIYTEYKNYILPVEHMNSKGLVSLGTCFLYQGGIVSAKHCFEDAAKISILGFSKEDLKNASFMIHENDLMDVIFIKPPKIIDQSILLDAEANILDEVITLGYPKVAGYHNFLAVEKATISSRFTATVGQLASIAEDIWIKEKLLLITARIQGGNSGGPVINRRGAVIGVSVNMAKGEGDYDDLGYGTVIPFSFVKDGIINTDSPKFLNMAKTEFADF